MTTFERVTKQSKLQRHGETGLRKKGRLPPCKSKLTVTKIVISYFVITHPSAPKKNYELYNEVDSPIYYSNAAVFIHASCTFQCSCICVESKSLSHGYKFLYACGKQNARQRQLVYVYGEWFLLQLTVSVLSCTIEMTDSCGRLCVIINRLFTFILQY